MKRFFGKTEAVFDILYLCAVLIMAVVLLCKPHSNVRLLSGIMALVLVTGDSFHLIPRIASILTGKAGKYSLAAGRGKQIASVTMTLFYVLLWYAAASMFSFSNSDILTAAVIISAAVRIVLCLLPQNRWENTSPPVIWGVLRNFPFFVLGLLVSAMYFINRNAVSEISFMWLAILLSFAFYLPVVLWSNKYRKIGMLMLPKSCMYIWIISMFIPI